MSTLLLRPLLGWLRQHRYAADQLLTEAGIEPATFDDLGARITVRAADVLWRRSLAVTGDPALGLHVARSVDPGSLGVVGYLSKSSSTIGEALQLGCRYWRLLTDAVELEVHVDRERAYVRYRRSLPTLRVIADYRIALLVSVAHALTGRQVPLLGVHLRHARPPDAAEYLTVLGVVPQFRSDFDGVSIPAAVLDIPLLGADEHLRAILESRAAELLARLPPSEGFVAKVRFAISAELDDRGELGLESVASRLLLTPATLRRRLRSERASYQKLADDVRQQLASRYLEDEGLSAGEVAARLGFGDLSAFSRAYKRWTGVSPSGRRARARAVTHRSRTKVA